MVYTTEISENQFNSAKETFRSILNWQVIRNAQNSSNQNENDTFNSKNKLYIQLPEQNTPLLLGSSQPTPSTDAVITPYGLQDYSNVPDMSDYFHMKHPPSPQPLINTILTNHDTGTGQIDRVVEIESHQLLLDSHSGALLDSEPPALFLVENAHYSGDGNDLINDLYPSLKPAAAGVLTPMDTTTTTPMLPDKESYHSPIAGQEEINVSPLSITQQQCSISSVDNRQKKKSNKRAAPLKQSTCKVCGEKFLDKNMKSHEKTHTDNRSKMKCRYKGCNSEYYYQRDMDRHERFRHLGKGFSCDFCDRQYDRKSKLTKHIQKKHNM